MPPLYGSGAVNTIGALCSVRQDLLVVPEPRPLAVILAKELAQWLGLLVRGPFYGKYYSNPMYTRIYSYLINIYFLTYDLKLFPTHTSRIGLSGK